MTQVISHGKRCHVPWCQQNTKKNWKLQDSESRNSESGSSEFRIGKLDFRIGKLEFWKSETGPGNFRIQKLQNSEFRKLNFRIKNRETGPGNYNSESRNSEFRKLDRETLELRIQETGPGNFRIQNSGNLRIQKVGIQNSEFRKLDRETSGFRIHETSELRIQETSEFIQETGPGNFRIQKLQNSELGNWISE